jgi:hypothetical protein
MSKIEELRIKMAQKKNPIVPRKTEDNEMWDTPSESPL